MTNITISYRRRDSDAITGRIFDRLVAHYGEDAVFRDIDNIPPGADFRKHINSALNNTNVLLAIVGPHWKGETDGRIRINEPTDLVRIEIEAALKKDIPVIPVLINNAAMPDPAELPDGLKDFAFRNAVKVDALEDFDDHMRRLIRSLDRMLSPSAPGVSSDRQRTVLGSGSKPEARQETQKRAEPNAQGFPGDSYHAMATRALTYALIGIVFFGFIFGPIAAIRGTIARSRMKASGNEAGSGRALAAILIGAFDTVTGAIILVVAVLHN